MKKLNKKGFTLIELMIVIAIIAILAAILVPNFVKARAQGQLTACKSNLKNIGTAEEMYAADHNGRYTPQLTTLTGTNGQNQYMARVPLCPLVTNPYTYSAAKNPDWYGITCTSGNHQQAGMTGIGYPQFDSIAGLVAPQSGTEDSNHVTAIKMPSGATALTGGGGN